MLVAIKIDLFTLRAVRETLPAVLDKLREYEVKASFFPALGPDPESGQGMFGRLLGNRRTIGEQAEGELKAILKPGHEIGAVPWDVAAWRRSVLQRDAAWTRDQIACGVQAYRRLFDHAPQLFAAPDFLVNADVSGIEGDMGFDFALDSRGLYPYRPMNPDGPARCPQAPVTLPRIEDVLASGESLDEAHQFIFMESQKPLEQGHLFSLTADNPAHLPVLEKLLVMWKGSQRESTTVSHMLSGLNADKLPLHRPGMVRRSGGGAYQAVQGEPIHGG